MLRYGYPYGTNENVCICENHPTQQIIRQEKKRKDIVPLPIVPLPILNCWYKNGKKRLTEIPKRFKTK